MVAQNRRLAVAGLISAAAIAVPTAALASGSGSPSPKPSPPQASAAAGKSAAQPQLPALAASAGISTDRLQAGLAAMKRAGGNTPAGIAAFAASADVTSATAQHIADAVFGTQADAGSPSSKPAPPQASAAAGKSAAQPQLPALAATAGISTDRLQAGLVAMKRAGGNTPAGIAAFAASADVTSATAQHIADAVFGTQAGSK